jgi:hypothetical protein
MSSRESTIFIVFQRSTEGQKIPIRADEFNINFEEISNGKALYDGCIIARHLDPSIIGTVAGIRSGSSVFSSSDGEREIVFSSAMDSTNYSVGFTFESAPVGGLTIYIKDKTVNGFKAVIVDMGSNPVDCSSENIDFSWQAIKHT